MSGRLRVGSKGCAVLLALVLGQTSLSAQTGMQRATRRNGSSSSAAASGEISDPAPATPPRTVSGRVVNALTGVPVPRALVNLNSRAQLTDAQGRFSFSAFTDANGYALVTKPGYLSSPTPDAVRQQKLPDLDAPVELKLYPDALLTGTVTGPDGLALSRLQVRVSRLTFDNTGPRWVQAGFTQTDVHGDYRFDVPAGSYRVSTGYTERSVERGDAVLPVSFPAAANNNIDTFQLANGEQRQVDLRPRVGPSYPVTIANVGDDDDMERGVRLLAVTPSGSVFPVRTQRSGEALTTQLPVGTFTLRATSGNRDESLTAETRVVVTGHGPVQAAIQLAPQPAFPVEATFEVAPQANGTATPATPSLQQFNLTLHDRNGNGEGFNADARLTVRPDRTAAFQVSPGRYRLNGNLGGGWYVRSATIGVTDLLAEDLVLAQGVSGSPIRLVVSNASGRLKGSVLVAGQPASGWVYLIPQQPSLVAYAEIYIQTDGTYRWSGPPGKYLAVPSAQQVRQDFRNPAVLRKFTAGAREVEISNGAEASLDLTLAPEGVPR